MLRKNGYRIILVLIGALLVFKAIAYWLNDSDHCIVPSIDWLTIDETVYQATDHSFSSELLVATREDAANNASLPLDGEIELIPNVKRLFKRVTNKQVAVSAAFFEQYNSKRGAICTMLYQLEHHDFPDTLSKLAMERQLLALLMELGAIGQQAMNSSENLTEKARRILLRADEQALLMEQKIEQSQEAQKANYRGTYLRFNELVGFIKIELELFKGAQMNHAAFARSLNQKQTKLETYFQNITGGA